MPKYKASTVFHTKTGNNCVFASLLDFSRISLVLELWRMYHFDPLSLLRYLSFIWLLVRWHSRWQKLEIFYVTSLHSQALGNTTMMVISIGINYPSAYAQLSTSPGWQDSKLVTLSTCLMDTRLHTHTVVKLKSPELGKTIPFQRCTEFHSCAHLLLLDCSLRCSHWYHFKDRGCSMLPHNYGVTSSSFYKHQRDHRLTTLKNFVWKIPQTLTEALTSTP